MVIKLDVRKIFTGRPQKMLARDLFAVANLLQVQTVCSTLTIPGLRMIFMDSQSFGTCLENDQSHICCGTMLWNIPDLTN